MKVKMKSGEKEIKITHKVVYYLKKERDIEVVDLIVDIGRMRITSLYDLMFAALKDHYKNIDDMLEDIDNEEVTNYSEVCCDAVGKLLGESSTEK